MLHIQWRVGVHVYSRASEASLTDTMRTVSEVGLSSPTLTLLLMLTLSSAETIRTLNIAASPTVVVSSSTCGDGVEMSYCLTQFDGGTRQCDLKCNGTCSNGRFLDLLQSTRRLVRVARRAWE